jgi:heme exporter protein A
MSVVKASNLSRRFGRRWAYARVDLHLEAGEKVLLIGANGSGKTTLLRTFSTLLSPSLGTLELFGQRVDSGRNLDAVRRRIGMLSHQTGLYEDLSIVDNLKVFAKLFGKPTDMASLTSHIKAVGLDGRSEPIRTYSAGMRKRASVALLRLKDPDLILLDEPFSALDPTGIDEIATLLNELPATQILVSHQVERAAQLCDRCVLLESGLIRWQGSANKAWDAWRKAQQDAS